MNNWAVVKFRLKFCTIFGGPFRLWRVFRFVGNITSLRNSTCLLGLLFLIFCLWRQRSCYFSVDYCNYYYRFMFFKWKQLNWSVVALHNFWFVGNFVDFVENITLVKTISTYFTHREVQGEVTFPIIMLAHSFELICLSSM